jgi:hypothetical protein
MRTSSSVPALIFIVIAVLGAVLGIGLHASGQPSTAFCVFGIALLVGALTSSAVRVADQWSKAVVLRLGKFRALQGPGIFLIIPLVDTIPYWIDTRVLTSSFKAEKTLTKDTVPVDVDAVLFWKIFDPEKAALAVADYQAAIGWASQTALPGLRLERLSLLLAVLLRMLNQPPQTPPPLPSPGDSPVDTPQPTAHRPPEPPQPYSTPIDHRPPTKPLPSSRCIRIARTPCAAARSRTRAIQIQL